MKKLTIKELAPYLPFGLKCHAMGEHVDGTEYDETPIPITFITHGIVGNEISIRVENSKKLIPLFEYFPILRPLSDLTKEIELNGEKFIPMIKLVSPDGKEWDLMKVVEYNPFPKLGGDRKYYKVEHDSLGEIISINPNNVLVLPYNLVQYLFEWHFDVFGLIEQNLAIDINTLQNER